MKLNNEGFSLIEILAVVVILSIIGSIMFSTIGNVINDTNEKVDEKNIESLISATKMFVNDHKYDIIFDKNCSGSVSTLNIISISSNAIINNEISGNLLYQYGYLRDNSLKDKKVEVIFDCDSKKFNYTIK